MHNKSTGTETLPREIGVKHAQLSCGNFTEDHKVVKQHLLQEKLQKITISWVGRNLKDGLLPALYSSSTPVDLESSFLCSPDLENTLDHSNLPLTIGLIPDFAIDNASTSQGICRFTTGWTQIVVCFMHRCQKEAFKFNLPLKDKERTLRTKSRFCVIPPGGQNKWRQTGGETVSSIHLQNCPSGINPHEIQWVCFSSPWERRSGLLQHMLSHMCKTVSCSVAVRTAHLCSLSSCSNAPSLPSPQHRRDAAHDFVVVNFCPRWGASHQSSIRDTNISNGISFMKIILNLYGKLILT